MSLIKPESTELTIDIPGLIQIGAVSYKRKIQHQNLQYSIDSKIVQASGIIVFYDEQDTPVAETYIVHSYGVSMRADNTTYCDMAGMVICSTAEAEADPSLIEGKDYMMQFDWFYMVASSQPIILNEMIKQFYLRAVEAGRFN